MTSDPIADAQAKLQATYDQRAYAIQHCPPCHCAQRSQLFFSFLLEGIPEQRRVDQDGTILEDCGYYCATCGWGNAGGRVVKEMQGEQS